MPMPRLRGFRLWLVVFNAVLLPALAIAALIWRDDILQALMDPKVPYAIYKPPPAPDYATVLQSPEPDRKRIQESLRTLDKYNGPIDGNLESDATVKAIQDWQKGRGTNPVGVTRIERKRQGGAGDARRCLSQCD